MKVSVIVPVYNSSKYLDSCLKSLVNQSLDELEIIAIDDNSLDNSLEILKTYQNMYPGKLRVYHNEINMGQSATRNRGIKLASGEYIGFLDSDDYVNYEMYKTMYEGAINNGNPEVVVTGLTFVKNNYYLENSFKGLAKSMGKNYEVENNSEIILNQSPSVCNKLFRSDTIKDKLFLDGRMWEDVAFSFAKMFNANNILVFNNKDYFYRRRADEGVSSEGYKVNSKLLDIFAVADKIEEETKEQGNYDKYKDKIKFIQIVTCLQRAVEVMSWPIDKESKDEIVRSIATMVKIKYGDFSKIPMEDLSSRIGFIEAEKLVSLVNNTYIDEDKNIENSLVERINTIKR